MSTPKVLALLMTLTSGCAPAVSEAPRVVCPREVEYSAAVQAQAAVELATLPKDSVIRGRFMPDYSRLRDQARACRSPAATLPVLPGVG